MSDDADMLTYARQEIHDLRDELEDLERQSQELRSALARREDELISATNECDYLRAFARELYGYCAGGNLPYETVQRINREWALIMSAAGIEPRE